VDSSEIRRRGRRSGVSGVVSETKTLCASHYSASLLEFRRELSLVVVREIRAAFFITKQLLELKIAFEI
jgi:hypothetical protein